LGVATVALAYGAGRLLWPHRRSRALLLGSLVSFQPMLTFTTSIINNSALEIALFSACLLVSLHVILAGLNWRRGILLGTLLGLGLLTKISFLSLVLLLGLVLAWQVLQSRAEWQRWRASLPWIAIVLIPAVLAGRWYADAVFSGGDTLLNSYLARPDRPPVSLLPYLAHYGWLTIYRAVLDMYWGHFGWLDTPLSESLWLILSWLTVIVAWTTAWRLIRQFTTPSRRIEEQQRPFAVFFLGCATLAVITFYTYLDYRSARDLGKPFGIQGRYYLPPIIGQMVWLMLGIAEPVPARLRRVWMWGAGAGMVALNLYALLMVILPRYYGSGPLLQMLERATVLQPISLRLLLMLSIAFVITTLAQLAALAGEK